jgi:membrane protein
MSILRKSADDTKHDDTSADQSGIAAAGADAGKDTAAARAAGSTDTDWRHRNSAPSPDAGPDGPTDLGAKGWFAALKRTFREFSEDNVSDWAAALTYYGVLSIFPGILVLVSILGLLGPETTQAVQDTVTEVAPSSESIVKQVVAQAQASGGFAGFAAIFGLLAAFWSASGYIAAFMRASNAIYDVPEGRPIWKTLPIRVGVTAVIGVMLVLAAVIVVFTGDLARAAGDVIGLGSTAVTVWSIAKWPVLVVLVSLMFGILYWASPNAKHGGFRWVSPGGVFAVLLWIVASGAFAFYLANFGNYNKTYGTLAGVIAFLVWLWISNIAILLGAEMDAELERGRAIAAGMPPETEPFLELRDDSKVKKGSDKGLGGS